MDENQLKKFKVHCERWLKYFETHDKLHCFRAYICREKTPEEYEKFGLVMDCLESYDENSTDPQIVGNGIFSKWRYVTHWAYDPLEEFDPEFFIKCFRKIAGGKR